MKQSTGADGTPTTVVVPLGKTVDLPGGLGTLSFESLPRYVAFDMRYDPALGWILAFALTALAGLGTSLFVPRRRVWLRVSSVDGRTLVGVAALARSEDVGLADEVARVLEAIRALGPTSGLDAPPTAGSVTMAASPPGAASDATRPTAQDTEGDPDEPR
jgi:cytochrome c biogenesis protein